MTLLNSKRRSQVAPRFTHKRRIDVDFDNDSERADADFERAMRRATQRRDRLLCRAKESRDKRITTLDIRVAELITNKARDGSHLRQSATSSGSSRGTPDSDMLSNDRRISM
jgi:hypothetical protein